MSNEDKIEVEGIVTQRLPGAMFEVTSTINGRGIIVWRYS